LKNELKAAANAAEIQGVVLMMSTPWKASKTFIPTRTLHEKEELSELIRKLGFNTERLPKWLVMLSGGASSLGHDSGDYNVYGGFPVFQCGPIDSIPRCANDGWSSGPFLGHGQYCTFEIKKLGD